MTEAFRDLRRDNGLVLAGETVLRCGWVDVAPQTTTAWKKRPAGASLFFHAVGGSERRGQPARRAIAG